ncbi:MAG: DUF882 domain-containing protein [Verrucomicrobia bacterium]|nr:DUF882 domain-containing protein [Verrucomicrobiota bacterium]
MKKVVLSGLLFLVACSSEEQEGVREAIERKNGESYLLAPAPQRGVQPHYPWEKSFIGEHPRMTRDFFRCKGCSLNPIKIEEGEHIVDCEASHHGLPLINGEEGVQPILIELLNEIQEKSGKRVVITCGHRCPQHNRYADSSSFNSTSKHMVGAEVDFYVQGMEQKPEEVVELLLRHYQEPAQRYYKDNTDVRTPPWYNREIFIKLYQEDEGRDFDNRHPYPYISIQVRAIPYSWPAAHRNYKKWGD